MELMERLLRFKKGEVQDTYFIEVAEDFNQYLFNFLDTITVLNDTEYMIQESIKPWSITFTYHLN